MKLAVISDIHANLPALKAVIKDIRDLRISTIWSLGDLVGYTPFPNETIALLRREKVIGIVGNYDLKVLAFPRHKKIWKTKKAPAKYFSFEWTERNLSDRTKAYLRKLPHQKAIRLQGKTFLLVHGSPAVNDEALSPDTPLERLRQLAKQADADVVLCGHSHRYFSRKVGKVWFANPGSVGRPFDLDSRASYMIINIDKERISFRNRRIVYPVTKTLACMCENSFPPELIRSISAGQSLDDSPDGKK